MVLLTGNRQNLKIKKFTKMSRSLLFEELIGPQSQSQFPVDALEKLFTFLIFSKVLLFFITEIFQKVIETIRMAIQLLIQIFSN